MKNALWSLIIVSLFAYFMSYADVSFDAQQLIAYINQANRASFKNGKNFDYGAAIPRKHKWEGMLTIVGNYIKNNSSNDSDITKPLNDVKQAYYDLDNSLKVVKNIEPLKTTSAAVKKLLVDALSTKKASAISELKSIQNKMNDVDKQLTFLSNINEKLAATSKKLQQVTFINPFKKQQKADARDVLVALTNTLNTIVNNIYTQQRKIFDAFKSMLSRLEQEAKLNVLSNSEKAIKAKIAAQREYSKKR